VAVRVRLRDLRRAGCPRRRFRRASRQAAGTVQHFAGKPSSSLTQWPCLVGARRDSLVRDGAGQGAHTRGRQGRRRVRNSPLPARRSVVAEGRAHAVVRVPYCGQCGGRGQTSERCATCPTLIRPHQGAEDSEEAEWSRAAEVVGASAPTPGRWDGWVTDERRGRGSPPEYAQGVVHCRLCSCRGGRGPRRPRPALLQSLLSRGQQRAEPVVHGRRRGCCARACRGRRPAKAALPFVQGSKRPTSRRERVDPAVGCLEVRGGVDIISSHRLCHAAVTLPRAWIRPWGGRVGGDSHGSFFGGSLARSSSDTTERVFRAVQAVVAAGSGREAPSVSSEIGGEIGEWRGRGWGRYALHREVLCAVELSVVQAGERAVEVDCAGLINDQPSEGLACPLGISRA
jgi:hypothetical protein